MLLPEIVSNLYSAFASCQRPEHFTDYKHCEECNEHDQTMLSASLETLNSEHLGCVGWAPFCFLTEDGFAHYMPRIIELAITGKSNSHGDLFLLDILFNLSPESEFDRFKNYSRAQSQAVLNALKYASKEFEAILEDRYYDEDIELAIKYWESKVNYLANIPTAQIKDNN